MKHYQKLMLESVILSLQAEAKSDMSHGYALVEKGSKSPEVQKWAYSCRAYERAAKKIEMALKQIETMEAGQ